MKTGGIIGIIVIALVIILGIFMFMFSGNQEAQTDLQEPEEPQPSITVSIDEDIEATPTSKTVTVEITSSGFSPRTLEINAGDTVAWTNMDSRSHWPASAVHPTHTAYPGSSINKCGGSDEGIIFDACKALSTGGSYSFTFNEKGSWNYHDHLRTSLTGTITVN